jgi:PAS domain S-box-containing protein
MSGTDDLEGYLDAGIHAVQTTPLVSRSGALLGMCSTHWREPHELSERELRSLDILARLAADVIERVRAEQALRESQQRLAWMYDTVRDVIFNLAVEPDGQFRFVSVNTAFLRVTGLSREAVVGRTVREVIPEPSLTMVVGKYRQAIETNTTVLWEETSDYPTGRLTGEVSVTPVLDNTGECTRLVGSVHDITERKRAEAALRESEQRYKEVFDNFSECIFVLDVTADRRFKIAGLNPAEQKAIGLSSTEVAGKFIEDVFPDDLAKRLTTHYRHCLEKGTIINYYEELNLPAGPRYFHTNLIPVRNDAGRIHRIIGCCLDFTDVKRTQEGAMALQKLESLGTLASGIAHDFNNLLGGVLAQTDLALADYDAGSYPEEQLKGIKEAAIRGSEIVRQLMIYGGKESAAVGLIDVSQIVGEMIALLKVSVSKRAVVKASLPKGLPAGRANAAQIRQIAMNLVTNASDAIGNQDGVIRVSTEHLSISAGAQPFKNSVQGDFLQLEVSDTGRGMSEETKARAFDPFFTTKTAGRGLGLAVVDGIVRSLRGAIHVASEPGKGTTFKVLLPTAATTSEAAQDSLSPTLKLVPSPQKFSILIVEDEELLRQAVLRMLRKKGFEVLDAANGSAAINILRTSQGRIDVMLLDMTIPGASSQEVAAEATKSWPNIKVILTSAYSQEMLTHPLSGPQIRGFIRKPFLLGDLEQTLRNALAS